MTCPQQMAARVQGRQRLFELLRNQGAQAVVAAQPGSSLGKPVAKGQTHPALPGFLRCPAHAAKPAWIVEAEDAFRFGRLVSNAVGILYGNGAHQS